MSIDTLLRTQLTSAVEDTTVPPGLAPSALAGGRTRRRRRRLAVGGALVAVVVAGGVLVRLPSAPTASEGQVAGGGTETYDAALRWARSLPEGPEPALPFFGAGGDLWSGGQRYDVPAEVNRSMAPREVAGGWLVFIGESYPDMDLAILGPDGTLQTTLPPSPGGLDDPDAVAVSGDGTQVAYDTVLVDLATLGTTELPHTLSAHSRVVGFIDDGLVYQGEPFTDGWGTSYLLAEDGSTTDITPPQGGVITGERGAGAIRYDYAADESGTCVTMWLLQDGAWNEERSACMGQYLREALAISPDADWLLTDDLPRVWDLADGTWPEVDVPRDVVASWGDSWLDRVVWEDADSFLIPVANKWTGPTTPVADFEQDVQVIRCTVPTGACERAGDRQRVQVTSTMWGATEVAFAQP